MTSSNLQQLISPEQIQTRVMELSEAISHDYTGQPLTLIGVMTGSLMFLADLVRHLRIPHQIGVVQASSYPGASTSSGPLRIECGFLPPVADRDLLIVDDILDTGKTLSALKQQLLTMQPASVNTAVLLWKQSRTEHFPAPDYFGFQIQDRFVVGYGLDYDDDFRHLNAIYEFQETPNPGDAK